MTDVVAPGAGPGRLGRRALVLGAPAGLLLAGCRWNDEAVGTTVGGAEPSAPAPDSDSDLVSQAFAAISAAHAAASDGRGARAARAQLLALHQAHLEHLGESVPTTSTELPAPGGGRGWAAVRRVERELQETLVGLAGSARSGALARTLASMAAGVAQVLADNASGGSDG